MVHATNRPDKTGMSRWSVEESGLGKYCVVLVSLVLFFAEVQAEGGVWTRKHDLLTHRLGPSASVVRDSIYVLGGISASPVPDSLSWIPIASGVNYAAADSALGEGVFIGLGGYTALQELVDSWVANLYVARLRTLGIRHLYSVKGPNDAYYRNREIGTLDLARHLISLVQSSPDSNRIIVAAHSAGSHVAHALFQDLYDGASIDSGRSTDGMITYFNLDGAIGAITRAMADRLAHIYGVYAFLPILNIYSGRGEMVALGNRFGSRSSSIVVDASGCGCISEMCLHMTLINQKPYNPTSYDWRDYGAINPDHPVQAAYLDVITGVAYAHHVSLWQLGPDTVGITARVENPLAHAVNVVGILMTGSGIVMDSVLLKDDGLHADGAPGDSVWGALFAPTVEDTYRVTVRTDDITAGASRTLANASEIVFSRKAIISLDTRQTNLGTIDVNTARRDTIFMVQNIGFASDSLSVLLDYVNVEPESAVAVSPSTFELAPGASQEVTFTLYPRLLAPKAYNAGVIIESQSAYGTRQFEKVFIFQISGVLAVYDSSRALPKVFGLGQNYPNPFNPSTAIGYQLAAASFVTLKVYDILGREVATLVNEEEARGNYSVTFSAKRGSASGGDASGLASGVYMYRLTAGEYVESRRMVLIR